MAANILYGLSVFVRLLHTAPCMRGRHTCSGTHVGIYGLRWENFPPSKSGEFSRLNGESPTKLGGGFKDCLFSPRKFGKTIEFDYIIFFKMGWFNHQN